MKTFNDITFQPHPFSGGIKGQLKFDNGWILSVIAGSGFYSTPGKDLKDPKDFSAFEIAVFTPKGDFGTFDVVEDATDDVIGWVTRDGINDIITKITNQK